MKNKISALFLALFASGAAYSNELQNQNLITCDKTTGVSTNCRISDNMILAPRQNTESDFVVSYKMTCDRKYPTALPSRMVVATETSSQILNYRDEIVDLHVGTGLGPLTLKDSFPKELAFRSFSNCELIFSKIQVTPSAKVKAVWKEQLTSKQLLLSTKEHLVRSLESVVILQAAYQVFETLYLSLDTDLKKNNEAIALVQKLAECKQGEACDVLSKMSADMALNITIEERLLIVQLRTILGELPTTSSPLVLKDRMSEQSIKILDKLSQDARYFADVGKQIQDEHLVIANLESEIDILKKTLGE